LLRGNINVSRQALRLRRDITSMRGDAGSNSAKASGI
jgi:hypothetical protein